MWLSLTIFWQVIQLVLIKITWWIKFLFGYILKWLGHPTGYSCLKKSTLKMSLTGLIWSIVRRLLDQWQVPLNFDYKMVGEKQMHRTIDNLLVYYTIPHIFSVNKLSQFVHSPTENHWSNLKRVICYLKGTVHHGLYLNRNTTSSSSIVTVFSNADWGGNGDDYTSTYFWLHCILGI